jgi:hypothetical protein
MEEGCVETLEVGHGETMIQVKVNGKTVTVGSFDQVGVLASEFKECVAFIHANRLLCPALSFAFCGIKDGDQIFAIRDCRRLGRRRADVERRELKFHECLAKRFCETNGFLFQRGGEPKNLHEFSRISDVFRLKIESNTTTYRRVCIHFMRLMDLKDVAQYDTVTVFPEKALEPSTELLPMLCTEESSVVKADK